jgi:hypothetical protein
MTAKLLDAPVSPKSVRAQLGLASRSRVIRDFVLLITICVSIGVSVGLGMMAAVLALL